jgi:cytidylate kinase
MTCFPLEIPEHLVNKVVKTPDCIAIDGPAASGKSTLGKLLADRLGYVFFDTGVMYRAATLAAMKQKIDLSNEMAVTDLTRRIRIDVRKASLQDGRMNDVVLDDMDVTWAIRDRDVERNVSQVSAYPGVREELTGQQRKIGERGRVVMIGRDIGTVVMPSAGLKLFLEASPEVRALRRVNELEGRGEHADYQEILKSMILRDKIDSSRETAPLKPAVDAVIISTDVMTLEQVYSKVIDLLEINKE